jgi:ABC-type multidrug transport system fused ATPase/permease subunit
VGLVVSTAAFALSHGATALAAGLLGRALVGQVGSTLAAQPERAAAYSIMFLGLLAASVKAVSGVVLAFCENDLAGRVGLRLRGRTVSELLCHGSYDAPPRVLATIAVRIREVEAATSQGVVVFVRSVAQLVPLAICLVWLSAPLSVAAVVVLGPFAVVVARLRRRFRRAHSESQDLAEELHRGVDELVRNVDLWRSYGAGARIAGVIDSTSRRAAGAAARVEAMRAALSGANEVLAAVALLGAVTLALLLGIPLGDGTLVAFAAVFFMAYRPLRDLGDSRAWCHRGAVALEALEGLSHGARHAAPPDCVRVGAPGTERLVVTALGARGRGPATNLTLDPGELVSVVGPTGSGKTTLLRVLLGLETARGQLRYGSNDLTDAPVGPAARPFAWVPQDAPLVTGTVLENVALHAPDERVAADALAQIGASGLLDASDQVVGPGGRPLSGGEQRQVAIARALASGQPVLLLDEPTTGLDAVSAERVLDTLRRLRGARSVLVVTHSPDVTAIADRVVAIGS